MSRYFGVAPALLIAAMLTGGHPAAAPAAPTSNSETADAADAKAFLEGLYAHYKTSKNNDFQMFDANAREVFDPDTIALIKTDRTALKGELGDLDGDWLCGCQDFTSLKATIAVQSAAPTAAVATSDFQDTGMADAKPGHEGFDLVKVGGAWRIHDIHTADTPSLRKMLAGEIKRLRTGGNATNIPDEAP
jgi:hypothetical protein